MTNTALYTKITKLPHPLQNEVSDYVEYLMQKHNPQKLKIHPKAGCMSGIFKMSPDFNEPLDDFNEFMK